MKRLISAIFTIFMLLSLLSTTALGATTISQVAVQFAPHVGEAMPTTSAITTSQDAAISCSLLCKFTGDDAIAAVKNAGNISGILELTNTYPFEEESSYQDQSYLFVFSLMVEETAAATLSNSLTITFGDLGKGTVFEKEEGDETIYFYLEFTPLSATTGDGGTGDTGGGNDTPAGGGASSGGNDNTLNGAAQSQNFDVKANYQEAEEPETVYSVDIVWGSMLFTYYEEERGDWNPDLHKYENDTSAYWTCAQGANAITVTNHSNTDISATFTYSAAQNYSGITGDFTKDGNQISGAQSIRTAEGTTPDAAPSLTVLLSLNGSLNETVETVTCGTVTVSVD